MNKGWFLTGTTVLGTFLTAAGCSFINAPSELIAADGNAGGASSSSSSSSSTTTSTSSSSTSTSTSTASSSSSGVGGMGGGMGGAGGTGGSSSSGMMVCEPNSQMPCYDGAPGTMGVGMCQAGTTTCLLDGSAYGPCNGQVVNAVVDDCKTPLFDENCDGVENDNCPGERVLVIGSVGLAADLVDVQAKLMGTGKFAMVDTFDAKMSTPALATLQTYTAVLVFSEQVFADPVTLGNTVADYYDGGGRVVLAVFSILDPTTRIQGRFGDPAMGYLLMDPAAMSPGMAVSDSLGVVLDPQHRLMRDVSAFSSAVAFFSPGPEINGATVMARWASGPPLIVRGVVQMRNRVDVNFYPPSVQQGTTLWTGNGAEILRNALLY